MADTPDIPLLAALGLEVRERRRARGLTLKQLGERAGVSERFLSSLEGGQGNISVARLDEVALSLGVPLSELFRAVEQRGRSHSLPGSVHAVCALVGLRGAGKTTLGKRVAEAEGYRFVELDAEIAEQSGMSLQTLFEIHGETYFRRLEREVLLALLRTPKSEPLILATGGSIVSHAETFAILRRETRTVWLRATPEDHWQRVVAQGDGRPMRGRPLAMMELRALLEARASAYASLDYTIDTSKLGLEASVRALTQFIQSSKVDAA
ncbi:MAG: shikimate kinase [Polyangiaceae bacterium]